MFTIICVVKINKYIISVSRVSVSPLSSTCRSAADCYSWNSVFSTLVFTRPGSSLYKTRLVDSRCTDCNMHICHIQWCCLSPSQTCSTCDISPADRLRAPHTYVHESVQVTVDAKQQTETATIQQYNHVFLSYSWCNAHILINKWEL